VNLKHGSKIAYFLKIKIQFLWIEREIRVQGVSNIRVWGEIGGSQPNEMVQSVQ
jgi:hypothetical protein